MNYYVRDKEKTPEEAENSIIELFAVISSRIIDEVEKKYGKESFELVKKAFIDSIVDLISKGFKKFKKRDLKVYIKLLVNGVTQGTKFEIVENKQASVRFKFTSCPLATYFRKIGKPEIGKFFCEVDEPLVKAFNKCIKFERTKTLMDGDDYCDHHYFA